MQFITLLQRKEAGGVMFEDSLEGGNQVNVLEALWEGIRTVVMFTSRPSFCIIPIPQRRISISLLLLMLLQVGSLVENKNTSTLADTELVGADKSSAGFKLMLKKLVVKLEEAFKELGVEYDESL